MPFDPNTIPPTERARLVKLGSQFGSSDALRQADLTLNGAAKHGAALALHGWGEPEATELRDLRDAEIAQGI